MMLVGSCVPNLGSVSQLEVTQKSGELNLVTRIIRKIIIKVGYNSGSKLVILKCHKIQSLLNFAMRPTASY